MKKLVLFCGLVSIAILTALACNTTLPGGGGSGNGGGSGTGGAPVAEFLPSDVSLDVNELPDEDAPSAKTKNDAAAVSPSPYGKTVQAAARIVHNFHRVANRAMALGAVVSGDMTSADQTQVSGTFTVNNVAVAYKVDFAAFDIDGDGNADGSGVAVTEPIAVRMWVDRGSGYERFLCALVGTRPSADNIGAGTLYTKPYAASAALPADLQIRITWDRTDPAHRWNEAYITGTLTDILAVQDAHQRVDLRTGTDSTLQKTVRSAGHFTTNPYGLDAYQSAVHFVPASGFALVSGAASGSGGSLDFANVCVDLVNHTLATGGQCDSFDTQDMTFIDFPAGGETTFPAAFPETPTF